MPLPTDHLFIKRNFARAEHSIHHHKHVLGSQKINRFIVGIPSKPSLVNTALTLSFYPTLFAGNYNGLLLFSVPRYV
jgi:DNA-binding helix-hairpin-helix protein with protein kinase domain